MTSLKRGAHLINHDDLAVPDHDRDVIRRVRRLAMDVFEPRAQRRDVESSFPVENYQDLRRASLLGLRIPREFGGLGLSSLGYASAILEIAKGDAATALTYNMHCTAMALIDRLATAEQKERLYARVLRDGALFSACASEHKPNPLDTSALPETTLTRTRGGFLLRGKKAYCSSAGRSDYSWVNAALDGRLVASVVPMKDRAVTVGPDWDMISMRGSATSSVTFGDVFIPEGDIVGNEEAIFTPVLASEYTLGYSPMYLGIAESAYCYARELARTKIQTLFGPEARMHPDAIRIFSLIGQMKIALESGWAMIQRAAVAEVGSFDRTMLLNEAHHVVAGAATHVTSLALQIAGSKGLGSGLPFERHFRDVQACLVMAPRPDHIAIVAGQVELDIVPRI